MGLFMMVDREILYLALHNPQTGASVPCFVDGESNVGSGSLQKEVARIHIRRAE